MTGAEIPGAVAAGKLAAKAAKAAAKESKKNKTELVKVAAESAHFKAAGESYAKRVALRQAAYLKLMEPLGQWLGLRADYFTTDFPEDISAKLESIPEENQVGPDPLIAVPAIEALGYSHSDEDIKDLYLSLIANASDDRVSGSTHPAFITVIKQLTGKEARLLPRFVSRANPCFAIERKYEDLEGSVREASHLVEMTTMEEGVETSQLSLYIDNWVRLGLVQADYDSSLTRDGAYDWVEEHPTLVSEREQNNRINDLMRGKPDYTQSSLEPTTGIIKVTNFGVAFATATSMTFEPQVALH